MCTQSSQLCMDVYICFDSLKQRIQKKMREEKKNERRENKMTPTLLQRLCVCVFAFCSVRTRVETFATQKKKRKEEREKKQASVSILVSHQHTLIYTHGPPFTRCSRSSSRTLCSNVQNCSRFCIRCYIRKLNQTKDENVKASIYIMVMSSASLGGRKSH